MTIYTRHVTPQRNIYTPRDTSVTPLELSNVYTSDKSCQLAKIKLACNKIWTRLFQIYMTQLPSQPTFNHVLSVHIIIFVPFKCLSFPWYFLIGMEKNAYQICKTVPTWSNARAQILIHTNILKGVRKRAYVPRGTLLKFLMQIFHVYVYSSLLKNV